MARVAVDLSDIILSIKDRNNKYLWYRVVDESRNNFSDSSVNYKVKISSDEKTSEYLTSSENDLFGR